MPLVEICHHTSVDEHGKETFHVTFDATGLTELGIKNTVAHCMNQIHPKVTCISRNEMLIKARGPHVEPVTVRGTTVHAQCDMLNIRAVVKDGVVELTSKEHVDDGVKQALSDAIGEMMKASADR